MKIIKLSEYGYEEAALGFSLSYNTSIERAKAILPRYAFGIPGESKFLESMIMYLDVSAPRYWWQEADTYRVGSTKQSESTMHTITKRLLTHDDFEYPISDCSLYELNELIDRYKMEPANTGWKQIYFQRIKNVLPEGFIQRRIWCLNYKTFRNIYEQRVGHRLPEWVVFCKHTLNQLNFPELVVKNP